MVPSEIVFNIRSCFSVYNFKLQRITYRTISNFFCFYFYIFRDGISFMCKLQLITIYLHIKINIFHSLTSLIFSLHFHTNLDLKMMQHIFVNKTVRIAIDKGIIKSKSIIVDATHTKARYNKKFPKQIFRPNYGCCAHSTHPSAKSDFLTGTLFIYFITYINTNTFTKLKNLHKANI